MRDKTKNEQLMYDILTNNKDARMNNYEACRLFYKEFGIELPVIKDMPSIWTVERYIRLLKANYKECNDDDSKSVKEDKITDYKEQFLGDNAYLTPEKHEQTKLGWW